MAAAAHFARSLAQLRCIVFGDLIDGMGAASGGIATVLKNEGIGTTQYCVVTLTGFHGLTGQAAPAGLFTLLTGPLNAQYLIMLAAIPTLGPRFSPARWVGPDA